MKDSVRLLLLNNTLLIPFIHFDSEINISLNVSNITGWTDKRRGLIATQGTSTAQPIYTNLDGFNYARFLNNNSKFLTFSLPANSGAIVGRAYFGFGNSVFACNISIPNSGSSTSLGIGRYGDYIASIIIFRGVPSASQELGIINELKQKISATAAKIIDSFFNNNNTTRLTNRITSFSGNTLDGITSATSTWNNCSALISFTNNKFPAVTNLTNAWNGCTNLATFTDNTFPSATNLTSAWAGCSALTIFDSSSNSFPLATDLTDAWNSSGLTTFDNISFPAATNLTNAWVNCSGLTTFGTNNSFPAATNLTSAWNFSGLITFSNISFPLATNISGAWQTNSLTTFSNNSFNAATSMTNPWQNCTALTTFTNNSFASATNLTNAWRSCTALTAFNNTNTFPSATNLTSAWNTCTGLINFDRFNAPNVVNVTSAWSGCNLPQESVDNILISLAAGIANNTTKTGFVGTAALVSGTNAAPGTIVRALTNSWEAALSQVNETLNSVTYNFSGGITGTQAKAWLLAKKGWTIATN